MKIVILDNIRSAHNVGAIARTAEALGVDQIIACGITPYPIINNDQRLPHVAQKAHQQIAKTALGAETGLDFKYFEDTLEAVKDLADLKVYGLEQTESSTNLRKTKTAAEWALVVGNEVSGVDQSVLAACDEVLEIPQVGNKESLNVSVAAGIAIYQLT